VDKLNSVDKLHHEVADVLSLKGTLANTDGLVKVAIGAELKDQVDVVLGLEGLEQVDDIGMVTKVEVDTKLLGTLIDCESGRAVDGGRALGDDLDSNVVTSHKVLGLENHAEGATVEWRDGLVSSIEHNAIVKLIAHALH
jgi:hypothetical protein